jgi:hypothetical protein
MGSPPSFDPYAPPTAPPRDPPAAPAGFDPWPAIARRAPIVCAAWALGTGVILVLQAAFPLRRFGGLEYVARFVALAALRATGPAIAFSISCLTAVVLVHRATRGVSASAPVVIPARRAYLVGGAIALAYPICEAGILLGALAALTLGYGRPAAEVLGAYRDSPLADLGAGWAATLIDAVLATLLLPRALTIVASSRWHLLAKLVVAWVVLAAVANGVLWVKALVLPG